MKKRILVLLLMHSLWINAQEYFPKNDGVKTTDEDFVAFTHAKIFIKPARAIEYIVVDFVITKTGADFV